MTEGGRGEMWRCPVCGRALGAAGETAGELMRRHRDFPFCSRRCRLVDLNAWLEGDYRIEDAPQLDEGGEPSAGAPPDA